MNDFKSFLLIPPIGLMSALEQSYLVRYPHKLKSVQELQVTCHATTKKLDGGGEERSSLCKDGLFYVHGSTTDENDFSSGSGCSKAA